MQQHGGQVTVDHRDAVLGTASIRGFEFVEEALADRVGLVVLVEAGPADDRVPHHLVDPGVLEGGPHEPGWVPLEHGKYRIDVDDAETEATVHDRIWFRLVQAPNRRGDVLRRLGDSLLGHDPDAPLTAGITEV